MDLVLPFDTDDPQFARGFEAGRLWEQLATGEPVVMTLHATNIEMAMRMAEARGWVVRGDGLGYEWVHVSFSRQYADDDA